MTAFDEHLSALRAQQKEPLPAVLLDSYVTLRASGIPASEYPHDLRKVMDAAFKEMIDASTQPNGP